MSPAWSTFLFECANFIVLVVLLDRLFFKQVRAALDKRSAEQADMMKKIEQASAEASQAKAEIARERQAAQAELERQRLEAVTLAKKEAEAILDRAREESLRREKIEQQRLASDQEALVARLGDAVAVASGRIVERLLRQTDAPSLDALLIKRACEQLGQDGATSLAPVIVETAHPLDEAQRTRISAALGQAASSATYRTVESLGMGVRIQTPRGVIDASANALSRYAIEQMNHQFQVDASEKPC